jgi:hypothetical protein
MTVVIRNNNGAVMFSQVVSLSDISISVSHYPAGMYQLEVKENGNMTTAKFIKQ